MNTFSADWLRRREPADRAAREAADAAMGAPGLAALRGPGGFDGGFGVGDTGGLPPQGPARSHPPARQVVDLGCGTGATLRHLAPRLGGLQHWRVFDHDDRLLQAWPAAMGEWARRHGHRVEASGSGLRVEGTGFCATVERHRADLSRDLDALALAGHELLCATALLDLVSARWLADLIDRARQAAARLSFALVVDGRIEWHAALPGDAGVARSFARHQGRDKGFGPALGARAPEVARDLLAKAGYTVMAAHSDWWLEGGDPPAAALQAALIDGMAAAAREQDPGDAPAIEAWRRLRTAALERTRLRVGHVDLIAVPPSGA